MTIKKRGRPKREDSSISVLFDVFAPEEYERLLIAGNVAEGRAVDSRDIARLLWWACVGHMWWDKHDAGETEKTPDECIDYMADAISSADHEHHAHYVGMASEVAIAVLQEDGLGTVERQQFRLAVRGKIVSDWKRFGGSPDKMERALTQNRKRKARSR